MDWLECTRYLRKVNKMDSKELDIVVKGLYPIVKRNSEWITRDKLEKLSNLLKRHNYFEGTRTDLEITMAYTYLDEVNFYSKIYQVKKNILDEFKDLFNIYNWLRKTSDYQVSITIPRKEVHKVIDKILEEIIKSTKVYLIKNVNGEYNSICYNKTTGEVKGSKFRLGYNLEEIKRYLNNSPLTNNYRYATREEVDNLLKNFYGLNPKNLPEGVIVEVIIGGE